MSQNRTAVIHDGKRFRVLYRQKRLKQTRTWCLDGRWKLGKGRRVMSKKVQQISVPLISVFLGILLGAIVMWIFGYDAIWGL